MLARKRLPQVSAPCSVDRASYPTGSSRGPRPLLTKSLTRSPDFSFPMSRFALLMRWVWTSPSGAVHILSMTLETSFSRSDARSLSICSLMSVGTMATPSSAVNFPSLIRA